MSWEIAFLHAAAFTQLLYIAAHLPPRIALLRKEPVPSLVWLVGGLLVLKAALIVTSLMYWYRPGCKLLWRDFGSGLLMLLCYPLLFEASSLVGVLVQARGRKLSPLGRQFILETIVLGLLLPMFFIFNASQILLHQECAASAV